MSHRPRMSNRLGLVAGVATVALLAAPQALALPVLGQTTPQVNAGGGQPTITTNSQDLTVTLNAQRTIIDWSTYTVQSPEAVNYVFGANNWIVLNRVPGAPIQIDGQLSARLSSGGAGGNIWLYSPQGVAFGGTAVVDVGGLLATSAAPDTAAFLNTSNLDFNFTGSGSGGSVTLGGGSQVSGRGYLAFVAPTVTAGAGANVNAGDYGTAAYGAVDSYEIKFIPAFNNDLTFFTFIVPGVAAGTNASTTPLNLSGTTTAANVYLIAISRNQLASLLINAPGLLVGQSSFNNYGQVTITTGRNITDGQVNELSSPVTGALTGDVKLGEINADGNVNIYLQGVNNGYGNVTADRIRAGQGFLLIANDVTVGSGGIVTGDSNVNLGNLRMVTSGTVTVPQIDVRTTFDLFVGEALGPGNTPTTPTLNLGSVTAGGDVLLYQSAALTADSVVAGGEAQLYSGGPVTLGSVVADGYTRISSSQTITVNDVVGGELDLRSAQGITANSLVGSTSVSVGTGGPATIDSIVGPNLSLDATTATLGSVAIDGDARLRVRNIDLLEAFSATNLAIEAANGDFTLGGADEPGLTDEEFQRIALTGGMKVFAGQRETSVNVPTIVYGDLTVGDLSIDPERIPEINLYAQNDHEVIISGVVRPTGEGVHLTIGDSEDNAVFAPGAIAITGSLGYAVSNLSSDYTPPGGSGPSDPNATGFSDVQAFDSISLYAKGDILIGSERFIDLVKDVPAAQIDIGKGLPEGVAAQDDEIGKVFLVAGALTAVAEGRIVQQNTGTLGIEAGFFLNGQGVSDDDPLLTVGKAQVADMFGALQIGDGIVTTGQQASFSSRIARLEGDTSTGFIRINGCQFQIGCALSTPASQFRVESFRPVSARPSIDPPVLTPPPKVEDDDREIETVVTGAGNEEIWRREK